MMSEDSQVFVVLLICAIVFFFTARALYGLAYWQGRRKKALFQLFAFPVFGLVLLLIIVPSDSQNNEQRADGVSASDAAGEADESASTGQDTSENSAVSQSVDEADTAALEACRGDLSCWGERFLIDASVRCESVVERAPQFSMEWTNGWLEPRFSRFRWENQDIGLITYIGDKARFQNGFGAWQNVIYFCTYDPNIDIVTNIQIEPGRLP